MEPLITDSVNHWLKGVNWELNQRTKKEQLPVSALFSTSGILEKANALGLAGANLGP